MLMGAETPISVYTDNLHRVKLGVVCPALCFKIYYQGPDYPKFIRARELSDKFTSPVDRFDWHRHASGERTLGQ